MKKIFTLICALVGLVATAMADSIKDLPVCKHSAVFVMDVYTNNGQVGLDANKIYDGYLFSNSATGKATNKGSVDLSDDPKYSKYGSHLNSVKLKDGKQGLVLKVTAGSKVIVYHQSHASRYIDIQEVDEKNYTAKETKTLFKGEINSTKTEWVADDNRTIRIGSIKGDLYVSYIIVEANEAPGTPSVKVGPQKYENGLWFREVTVTRAKVTEEGSEEQFESVVTYTTDGSAPDENSDEVPNDPIKVYKDQTLKFQAFMPDDIGKPALFLDGAENEAVVSFSFEAPTITADKGNVTVTTPYAAQGGANVITYGDKIINGDNATLTESAVVSAKTVIPNGTYGKFESKSASIDALVLTPIKEKKEIKPIAGEVVVDEEATAGSTDGKTYYKVENGKHNADPKYIFFKNPVFGAVTAENAKYQVPEGQEVYLQMKGDDIAIYFETAQKSLVTITASKNSCKNIDKADDDANNVIFAVKMDGTDQQVADIRAEHDFVNGDATEKLPGNVLKFFVEAGTHKMTRNTRTSNIFLSSIVIEPAGTDTGINDIEANSTVKVKKVIENGQIVIVKGNNKYNAAGAQIK